MAVVPASAPARNRAATVRPEAASSPRVPSAAFSASTYAGKTANVVALYGRMRTTAAPVPRHSATAPSCLAIRDATDHALLGVSCGQGGTPGGPYEVAFT